MELLIFKHSFLTQKMMLVISLVLCSFLLSTCNDHSNVDATFTGVIETVHEEGTLSVIVDESTGTKLQGKVHVNIPEDTEEIFNVGDKIKVGFDGTMLERHPPFIQTITMEKVNN